MRGIRPESRAQAADPSVVGAIGDATAVFMTGGNQTKLAALVVGTPLGEAIVAAHRRGALIAGTSAGASVCSEHMVSFGSEGATPKFRVGQVSQGLGLLTGAIVDQHFTQRNRFGRLLALVGANPAQLGIGIDEDTAAIVAPGGTFEVRGRGVVTVIDGADLITTAYTATGTQPLMMSNLRLHTLPRGAVFDLHRRVLVSAPGLADTDGPQTVTTLADVPPGTRPRSRQIAAEGAHSTTARTAPPAGVRVGGGPDGEDVPMTAEPAVEGRSESEVAPGIGRMWSGTTMVDHDVRPLEVLQALRVRQRCQGVAVPAAPGLRGASHRRPAAGDRRSGHRGSAGRPGAGEAGLGGQVHGGRDAVRALRPGRRKCSRCTRCPCSPGAARSSCWPRTRSGTTCAPPSTPPSPPILAEGVPGAIHAIVDHLVDGYAAAIDALEDAVGELSKTLFDDRPLRREQQLEAFRIQQAVSKLRRSTRPMRDVAGALANAAGRGNAARTEGDAAPTDAAETLLGTRSVREFSDVADHADHVAQAADSLREAITSMYETNLALADVHLNTVMKKLSGWAAIIAVPTLITGFMGMNVPYPGYGTTTGFVVAAAVIVVAVISLYVMLRRKDWL